MNSVLIAAEKKEMRKGRKRKRVKGKSGRREGLEHGLTE